MDVRRAASLSVLQSFPAPTGRSNPYVAMLLAGLGERDDIEVRPFTWRRALLGRYDVFHAHWPENLVTGRRRTTAVVRQVLFLLILVRLRLSRTPLVRTLHNVALPGGLARRQRAVLRLAERWTTLFITLNPATVAPAGRSVVTIPHGDYRDWYAALPRAPRVPQRATFVGLVRRYKGVDALVRAFAGTPAPASLRVAGLPSSDDLAAELRAAADADPRISLELNYLDDAAFVREVSAATVVVLPYPFMHNSGTALAALSLDRPVLVPDNEVNRSLGAEVGERWVRRFAGGLDADDLAGAIDGGVPDGSPDLSARNWHKACTAHVSAYRQALADM